MATFEQRASGWWQAKIRRKGYPPQSKTFERKADARAWALDIENKMDRGVFEDRAEAEGTTLFQALERYEREISRPKKGHDQERYRIRSWQSDTLSMRSLASLKGADFSKWRDERLVVGAAPATVRLDLAVISHLFTIAAKEWGIPVTNPVKNIRMPRANNARERRLEAGEEDALLAALESPCGRRSNPWIKPMVMFAIETALRQGELFGSFDKKGRKAGLWRENVSLDTKVARVLDTKNGDAYRDVPLSPRAVETLRALPTSISGEVFPTTESALSQSWNRAVKRARRVYELECEKQCLQPKPNFMVNLHFHDLRHEATSRLAEKFDMHELMKVTGHKDARMLARYYHPRAEDLARKLE